MKPKHYDVGIDTFDRMFENMDKKELMACVRFNIDKYNIRNKGQDKEDLKKIIEYAKYGLKVLEEKNENNKEKVMFKKIKEDAILPQAQTKYSAGYDVYASEDVTIKAGETKLVPLGIALDLTEEEINNLKDCFFGLYLRSSYGARGLIMPNGVGVIDIDYTGEIKQAIHNPIKDYSKGSNNEHFVTIKKGDRVGQLILHKHYGLEFISGYRKDAQRQGGFGSSGER